MIAKNNTFSTKKDRKVKTRNRFVGIGRDAQELGVSRITLYMVLNGNPQCWALQSLRERYAKIFQEKSERDKKEIYSEITDSQLREMLKDSF